nr:PREDICTED: coiled-coil domain-containing protein 113-like [Megachile rotundata]
MLMMPRSSRMSFRESIIALHDPSRRSVLSMDSFTSLHSGSRFGSQITMGTSGDTSKITIAHRMTMARNEVEEMRKALEKVRETTTKKRTYLRAELEELEIRISETQEAKEEFEEDVVAEGVNRITGKIPAEKIVRFVEEWLRSANTIVERLRLRSATLRTQIKRAQQQLIQREELGESLHVVDFEKLTIENQDYVKMIEEKNRYVIDMKRIAGHYHLKLTQRKQKLNNLVTTLNEVQQETIAKKEQIKNFSSELKVVQAKVNQKTKLLKNLVTFVENHIAPDILDFVYLQAEFQKLEKVFKRLQRRRDIDRIIYHTYKKRYLRKIQTSSDYLFASKHRKKLSDTRYPVQFFPENPAY